MEENQIMTPGVEFKVHNHGFVKYIEHMGSDSSIVEAARVSYNGQSKGQAADRKLLEYLLRNGHTSPFEMAKIVFNLRLPVFCERQRVRHRMQNMNEVSARYTELPDEFFLPAKWRAQDTKNKQSSILQAEWDIVEERSDGLIGINQHVRFNQAVQTAFNVCYATYQKLIADGVAREQARIVLPLGIYTEVRCCFDLHNLLHFLRLRTHKHAQEEIRDYANVMRSIATALFPWTMGIWLEMEFEREQYGFWRSEALARQEKANAEKTALLPGRVAFQKQEKL